ncbi:MAG: DUF512 domain-containing protein [Alphaproteobacteria bacterium]|uniref:DUF512 domain-containing protein n=1 Tax=Candidatus Nitrobium versatile TaxID=2884831 RepID=A0A953LWM5_9BACT|nr:DUF512 domain-containing protein [Candidatus Nitrobium versatile]
MPAKNNCGVEVEQVHRGSLAEKAGVLPGDRLVALNGHRIRDSIDLMFYGNEPEPEFHVSRDGERLSLAAPPDGPDGEDQGDTGIVLKPFKIRACRNNCLFCFVSQLPKGMRRTLYVRDDDYRMSFLFGSYITLTNLTDADRQRIVEQRLSPLYISVHSADPAVRNRLLGNQKAADIMKELKFLAGHRIRMHTQIVLCPGVNDGKGLMKTISDLYRFYPYVLSIAVVPVGLTGHRKKAIPALEGEDAAKALDIIHKFQSRFKRKHGECIVYGADELYIKAEREFPPLMEYGEFPQIENGVGMVPFFLHQAKRIRMSQTEGSRGKKERFITFTGVSFYPFLSRFVEKIRKNGIDIEVVELENSFFGKSVTVAGLLTGRDVIRSLSGVVKKDDILLVPDIVLRTGDEIFLDDVSLRDMEEVLGVRTVVVPSTPRGLVDAVTDAA